MNHWWIDGPRFLGSSNLTTDELKELHKQSFRALIFLLDENEQPSHYDLADAKALGFDRVSIPIRDFPRRLRNSSVSS